MPHLLGEFAKYKKQSGALRRPLFNFRELGASNLCDIDEFVDEPYLAVHVDKERYLSPTPPAQKNRQTGNGPPLHRDGAAQIRHDDPVSRLQTRNGPIGEEHHVRVFSRLLQVAEALEAKFSQCRPQRTVGHMCHTVLHGFQSHPITDYHQQQMPHLLGVSAEYIKPYGRRRASEVREHSSRTFEPRSSKTDNGLRSEQLMMRAHGAQKVDIWRELFVYQTVVAGDVDTGISIVGMMQFVIVKQGVGGINGQQLGTLKHFSLHRLIELIHLPIEHPMPTDRHGIRATRRTPLQGC